MSRPHRVTVVEVGPRDGFQMEPRFIPSAAKIKIINRLIDAGIREMEATSFVSPRAVPQLADAREIIAGIERRPGLVIKALVPNPRGARDAAACEVDQMVVFVSASETHNQSNVNRSLAQSLDGFGEVAAIAKDAGIALHGAIATSFGCPFEGDVSLEAVGRIAERMAGLGCAGISLGDTTGMATPPIVERTVRFLQDRFPELHLALHYHNTRGLGLVNVMTGLDLGIDTFESSIGGLGGCPFAPGATGNICTEDLVNFLHELGIETGIDLGRLIGIARSVEEAVGHEVPGQVMKAGPRLQLAAPDACARAVG
jgi:hydroxymethylglutaryl-CoA lyase